MLYQDKHSSNVLLHLLCAKAPSWRQIGTQDEGATSLQMILDKHVSDINDVARFVFKNRMRSAFETVSAGTVIGFGCVVLCLQTGHISKSMALMCCLVVVVGAAAHYVNYLYTAGRKAVSTAKEYVELNVGPEHKSKSGVEWSFVEEKCSSVLFSMRFTHFVIKRIQQKQKLQSKGDAPTSEEKNEQEAASPTSDLSSEPPVEVPATMQVKIRKKTAPANPWSSGMNWSERVGALRDNWVHPNAR